MDRLKIERRGGFTGLRAGGELDPASLSQPDREAIDQLFRDRGSLAPSPGADRFTFTLTRQTGASAESVEVPEHLLPQALAAVVKDELP